MRLGLDVQNVLAEVQVTPLRVRDFTFAASAPPEKLPHQPLLFGASRFEFPQFVPRVGVHNFLVVVEFAEQCASDENLVGAEEGVQSLENVVNGTGTLG
jgi:hypothetical protein